MVAPAEMSGRNDMTLWASDVMLADLLSRAPDWSTRSECECFDFFLEWEEMMDRLSGVAADAQAGRLTADQHDRSAGLAVRLAVARAAIEALGLDSPHLGRLTLAS